MSAAVQILGERLGVPGVLEQLPPELVDVVWSAYTLGACDARLTFDRNNDGPGRTPHNERAARARQEDLT